MDPQLRDDLKDFLYRVMREHEDRGDYLGIEAEALLKRIQEEEKRE